MSSESCPHAAKAAAAAAAAITAATASTTSESCPHATKAAASLSTNSTKEPQETCPVVYKNGKAPPQYNAAINDVNYAEDQNQIQSSNLSTERSTSTIPKSQEHTPSHQPKEGSKWVYPSERQYYTAMKRKGYNPDEQDVPVILTIHNMVNEQGWAKIKEWEKYEGVKTEPKLKKFMGRPQDLSPKARFMGFLGYTLPFDRHDWVVERGDGKDVRYVIDFYQGRAGAGQPFSMYLDVRPALDSLPALFSVVSWNIRKRFGLGSMPVSCLETDGGLKKYMPYLSNSSVYKYATSIPAATRTTTAIKSKK